MSFVGADIRAQSGTAQRGDGLHNAPRAERASMFGQFYDFRSALAIALLACSSHPSPSSTLDEMRSRGCWRSSEYNFSFLLL
jgi:hypothetical protein